MIKSPESYTSMIAIELYFEGSSHQNLTEKCHTTYQMPLQELGMEMNKNPGHPASGLLIEKIHTVSKHSTM